MEASDPLKPTIAIDGVKYEMDLRRVHEIVETLEDVVSCCEMREQLERMGEWTPKLEDEFGGMIKDARSILGTPSMV